MFAPASTVSKHFFIIPVFITPPSTVYRTLAHRLVCHHDVDHVINDEHNRIITVVLAKHEVAP
jgi:hypothetical protein